MWITIAAATRKAEEIVDEKITELARAIRREITEAWNKGQK